MVGKSSRTAKTKRGMEEVLRRIARCALDAVDEADLQLEGIAGTAVLTNGLAGAQTWEPQDVNRFANHLPPNMGANLLVAGRIPTIMWAVHEEELGSGPKSWLGLFTEPEPTIVAAERALRGQVKPVAIDSTRLSADSTFQEELLAVLKHVSCEVLLLVGKEVEDARSSSVRALRESLSTAGIATTLHIPIHGAYAGTWAAARLAARTFVG